MFGEAFQDGGGLPALPEGPAVVDVEAQRKPCVGGAAQQRVQELCRGAGERRGDAGDVDEADPAEPKVPGVLGAQGGGG